MATGAAKVAVCQPVAVSSVNVAVPRFTPAALHRCPTWVPVLPLPL
jgi:hypothetical protein